jgi:hypothetical protein
MVPERRDDATFSIQSYQTPQQAQEQSGDFASSQKRRNPDAQPLSHHAWSRPCSLAHTDSERPSFAERDKDYDFSPKLIRHIRPKPLWRFCGVSVPRLTPYSDLGKALTRTKMPDIPGRTTIMPGDLVGVQSIPPSNIRGRVSTIIGGQWYVTSPPTQTQQDAYQFAATSFEKALAGMRGLLEKDLKALEDQLEAVGAPWTPGRIPVWVKE